MTKWRGNDLYKREVADDYGHKDSEIKIPVSEKHLLTLTVLLLAENSLPESSPKILIIEDMDSLIQLYEVSMSTSMKLQHETKDQDRRTRTKFKIRDIQYTHSIRNLNSSGSNGSRHAFIRTHCTHSALVM